MAEPTASELAREIERNYREILSDLADLKTQFLQQSQHLAAQIDRYVLKEVYHAEMTALNERIRRLEDEAAAARQSARNALWGAAGAILAAIIGVVVTIILTRTGGGSGH